jgi:glutamine phosphoribosylpyrophosphate amidotransferase
MMRLQFFSIVARMPPGIVTSTDGSLFLRKDNGLVRDVFQQRHMQRLIGKAGIGHVRYPTAGSSSSAEAQPFYVNSPYGITLAHNGNLTNVEQLAKEIYESDLRHQYQFRLGSAAQRLRPRVGSARQAAAGPKMMCSLL